ncbi:hypothetical protein [Ferruginibacter albus]|uniref:hypothetical protein n=1 Tax=Ferruginibacter albus TaxID=2875540 RepID=UPI001CC4AD50|nr:hypothetical protein [Ferruginibacter albus]UAY52745.1 hypothetical protein K9M53_03395 [Ferruginibacter albus]
MEADKLNIQIRLKQLQISGEKNQIRKKEFEKQLIKLRLKQKIAAIEKQMDQL